MDPRPTDFFLDLPVAEGTFRFPLRFSVQDGMAAHFHLTTKGHPRYEHPLCPATKQSVRNTEKNHTLLTDKTTSHKSIICGRCI